MGSHSNHMSSLEDIGKAQFLAENFINQKQNCPKQDGAFFDVFDPATMKSIAQMPDSGEEECIAAIRHAKAASPILTNMTGKQRGRILRKWFDLVVAAQDELAKIITAENGKTLAEARGEVLYAADFLEWFAGQATRIDGSVVQASAPGNRIITIKQPVGVVGIVTPWNFPAAMVTRKVAAALAAGCPCVVKPAAETPLTALALTELARRAGVPDGALNIITTLQNTVVVGKTLTTHPDIRKFSFTGSTAVGKVLAAQCTSTMKKVSLELGGNAPFVVFEDADIDQAVDGLLASKFRLAGQTCVCVNRAFVQASIYERFASAVAQRVSEFRLGPGSDPHSTIGPLISEKAAAKVHSHVQDALSHGADIILGGQPAQDLGPAFYQPTVITNVSTNSLLMSEETFGPLLPLISFESEEQVLEMANATTVGLAGYFFSKDVSRAWRVAEALEVGMVGVNTGIISDVASPFGGIKESGIGREGSVIGIDEYLQTKSITFKV